MSENVKKRSTYKAKDRLALPDSIDKKKYGYRWLSKDRLAENSDGYDPRGWELHKEADGKTLVRGDLVLGRMPIDEYEEMKAEKDQARRDQMELVLQKQAENLERESHEFRKKGGKIQFNFEQN